ncbi:MAG: metallophosphoesterase [Oscillospiraceae bacterium]|nr:metallophosphoesterase [Oscillospiraceae bacterium]
MIYLTGDIHGHHSISKFSTDKFPIGKSLTREDYVIICGDFGLVWADTAEERYWLKWLEGKPWTTLWIDGNHENFDRLREYPEEDWHGGRVQRISEHVLHLCRGYVFEIGGKSFFAFGGAESHDKEYRVLGKTIWNEELPSPEEMERGRRSLEAAGWKVDYVVSHSLPQHMQEQMFNADEYEGSILTRYFDEIAERLDFGMWFSGHYHTSYLLAPQYCLLYHQIIELADSGFLLASPKMGGLLG